MLLVPSCIVFRTGLDLLNCFGPSHSLLVKH